MHPSVLLVTPFRQQHRGNYVTSQRLEKGLSALGYNVETLALDCASNWAQVRANAAKYSYQLLHVLHAASIITLLQDWPELAKLPLLLTTTGTDIHIDLHGPLRTQIEQALQRADRIVVFNPAFVTLLKPEYFDKVTVIPQGVDLACSPPWPRARLGCHEDDLIVVLPSGLRPVKRIEFALEAMEEALLSHSRLHLLIAGPIIEAAYGQAILNQIDQLPRVSYLGEIDHAEMAGLLAWADMVLNTSLVEGQPQAALEAMSLGVPALMSAVPGNLGIMTSGQEGIYVESPHQLAEALVYLAENHALRKEMGLAAARLVREKYSVDREIKEYHRLYQNML